MTPARLHLLSEMDAWANDEAEQRAEKPRPRRAAVSKNPAADLSALARL